MSDHHHNTNTVAIVRRTHRQRVVVLAVLVILPVIAFIAVVGSGSNSDLSGVVSADTNNVVQVATGQRLYATRCAGCHGTQLEGAPGWSDGTSNGLLAPPLDARSLARQRDDAWIFRTIKEGGQATAPPGTASSMPALGGGMSDEEIWAVIAAIKHTWTP